MAGAVFLLVFLLVAIAAPLVLYALVRAEHDQREQMDRATAEQVARRDTDQTRRSTDRNHRNTDRDHRNTDRTRRDTDRDGQ